MLDATNQIKLANYVRPGPCEPELDQFAAFVRRGAVISGARWYCVEAEDCECEMRFKPEGGLTEHHYRRLGTDPLERMELARAVIENLLRRRGHGSLAIEEAFRGVNDETLPGLVEEYSFGAMADALESTILSPRPASNARLGRGLADTSRTADPGSTTFRPDPLPPDLVVILHRLVALEMRIDDVARSCRPRPDYQSTPSRTFLHAEEAADCLGITLKALYSLKDRGRLKSLPGSRKLRFTPKMLDDYLHGRK